MKILGDIISVLGAVILFFSWIITNTLQQEYQAAKASAQRAESDERVYESFRSLGQTVENVAAEVIQLSNDIADDRNQNEPATDRDRDRERFDETVRWLGSKTLNARQIDWAYEGCGIALTTVAQAVTGETSESQRLRTACEEIWNTRSEKEKIFSQIKSLLGTGSTLSEAAEEAIRDLSKTYGERILPRLQPALQAVVESSNSLRDQMRSELREATSRASQASGISFFTYLVGTLMILVGRIVEKLFPAASLPSGSRKAV